MKNLVALLCVVMACVSCNRITGSGNIITEKKNTGNFTGIDVSNAFEVEVKQGDAASVSIEADDNVMQHIETRVEGHVLYISLKHFSNLTNVHLKAFITAPEITSINASAAASVTVKGQLSANGKISLDASSAANITAKVDAPAVEAEASSGGTVSLSGTTKNETVDVSSAGSVKAERLLSESTTATASSGGNAEVNISVSLKANASSGGNINYRGNGNINKEISSGGNVEKVD